MPIITTKINIIIPEKKYELTLEKKVPMEVNNGSWRGVTVPRPAGPRRLYVMGVISVPSLIY